MSKWLYKRDYESGTALLKAVKFWKEKGFRVFVVGSSAMDVEEY